VLNHEFKWIFLRKWEFVVSADVEKMCRQIKINYNNQQYQYILWRSSPVTYGTASASYLATRFLVDIADR